MKISVKFFACILAIFLASCCPCRKLGTDTTRTDSVRVETREIVIERVDTAFVEIPVEVVRNVTRDTSSTIETKYAVSTATIADGFLWHDIATKDTPVEVHCVTRTEYRDSIQYRDRTVTVTNRVEIPAQLTRWQRFQQNGFWAVLGLLTVTITIFILKWWYGRKIG